MFDVVRDILFYLGGGEIFQQTICILFGSDFDSVLPLYIFTEAEYIQSLATTFRYHLQYVDNTCCNNVFDDYLMFLCSVYRVSLPIL